MHTPKAGAAEMSDIKTQKVLFRFLIKLGLSRQKI